jgi:hypothetical protein
MWRALETGPRQLLTGHEEGNLGHKPRRSLRAAAPALDPAPGHVEEVEPWQEGAETWRVLRAQFPGFLETHSRIQEFFFDTDLHLRRHDYQVNIAGGFPAAQLTSDYVVADGIHLPTRRRAYTRGPDRRPITEMLMVSIDIAEVRFEPA